MDTLRERVLPVLGYIREEWESTVRTVAHDAHPRLYLPHEFTTPCAVDQFQELYYWDTYFTHLGLLRDGRVHLAQSNVLNMFYMIRKFGFVLNSNAVWHLNRSQPPYLSMMVREVFDRTGDRGWLRAAYEPLRSEYDFWMTRRMTDVGLNRYLHDATDHDLHEFYDDTLAKRLGFPPTDGTTKKQISYHYVAEAESGHDFTPRFDGRCADFAPIDLNSNLYEYERNFAEFAHILENGEEQFWAERSEERLARIRRYCWDARSGAFNDYDTAQDAVSTVVNATMFWPLVYGLATPGEAEATVRLLRHLEGPHGVSTCADTAEARRFQWGFPNAWPPIQVMVCKGLARYGFKDDAVRIARKYVETVTDRFEADGFLWEKYDSQTGNLGEAEYEANRMLGWTAGVFVYLAEFLGLR